MKKWILLGLLVACGPSREQQILTEAGAIHNEAMEIAHQTSLKVSHLKQRESSYEQQHQDSLRAIMKDLGEWYDTVVEVPGQEHDHEHHDHDHDHDHHHHGEEQNYLEGLSAEEVLQIQQALNQEIQALTSRVLGLQSAIRTEQEKSTEP